MITIEKCGGPAPQAAQAVLVELGQPRLDIGVDGAEEVDVLAVRRRRPSNPPPRWPRLGSQLPPAAIP
jgi:hypothetical protein